MKLNELRQIIREEVKRVMNKNNQLEETKEDDKIFQKNERDIIKLGLEGARDWKRGVGLDYGPYKDKDSFEYMYWKKGWEDAELKDEIEKG